MKYYTLLHIPTGTRWGHCGETSRANLQAHLDKWVGKIHLGIYTTIDERSNIPIFWFDDSNSPTYAGDSYISEFEIIEIELY